MRWHPANNPYNFVPFGPPVRLGDEPASHARLQGLSGTIVLQLENETPLLVSQRVNSPEELPPRLENFKINGRPAIPGTSIKGMVRSILETLTNSCFVIFDGEPLDHRMAAQDALKLRAGRVVRLPAGNEPGLVEEMERAWIAMEGFPPQVNAIINGGPPVITLASVPSTVGSGDEVWLRTIKVYRERLIRHQMRRVGPFNLVTDFSPTHLPGYRRGIYKITGKSIDMKKRERVFLFKTPAPQYEFSRAEVEDYHRILKGHKQEHTKRGGFALTEPHDLAVGSLVYFAMQGNSATRLSRVEIPRTPYQKSRGDRLPEAYHKCADSQSLCIACRLFGFTAGLHSACGRINFADAEWISGPGDLEEFFPLKVLGEPHPTSCNFYLIDPQQSSRVRNYDGLKISDGRGKTEGPVGDVQLRGRKFYFHHRPKSWEKYHCPDPEKFRRVLNEVRPLKPGNVFKFRVNFRNLSEAELGLLLYSLLLEEPLRHKLGLAKPLGFGTVKITCQSLTVSNGGQRYESYGAEAEDKTSEIPLYIQAMKESIRAVAGQDFHQLINVAKLRKILDPAQAPADPGYPFDPEGKKEGFAWYASNKNVSLPEL